MMLTDAHRAILRAYGTLLARVLIGLLFLVTGVQIYLNGVGNFAGMLESLGVPAALLVAWVIVVVKILASIGLILGYRVGLSAAALIVFILGTIVFVHNNLGDQLVPALKNLSIIAGLIYIMSYGPGNGWRVGR